MFLKTLKLVSVFLVSMLVMTGCLPSQTAPISNEDIDFVQLKEPVDGQETAVITTTHGTITMLLFEEQAPNTVANFKQLIKNGFYNDKQIFIEQNAKTFVTGASDENGASGEVAIGDKKPIVCETTPNLWHFSGAVSVLGYEKNKLSKTFLSDSRFFIIGDVPAQTELINEMQEYNYPTKVIDAYKEHGGLPQYTGAYTVFGQVIEGLDVVNKISQLEHDSETKIPVEDVRILKIELSTHQASKEVTSQNEAELPEE